MKTFKNTLKSQSIMKLPKQIKRFCPKCKTSKIQKVDQYKSVGKRGSLSKGSKIRIQKRGKHKGFGNHGKLSKPPISKFKRTGAKISKKTTLRYQCTECKKYSQQRQGIRAKKVEIQ